MKVSPSCNAYAGTQNAQMYLFIRVSKRVILSLSDCLCKCELKRLAKKLSRSSLKLPVTLNSRFFYEVVICSYGPWISCWWWLRDHEIARVWQNVIQPLSLTFVWLAVAWTWKTFGTLTANYRYIILCIGIYIIYIIIVSWCKCLRGVSL